MGSFSAFHWLIIGTIVYVFWRFFTRPHVMKAPAMPKLTSPAFTWPKLDEYDFEVVGESAHQKHLKQLAGNHGENRADVYTTALLVPYSSNPHDDKAVRVDIDGQPVGHLSRDDARAFRRRLGAKKLGVSATACGALVMGGFTMPDGASAHYGVRLDLKLFES